MSACRNKEVIAREHVKSTFRTVISIKKQMAETSGGLCVTRVPGAQQVMRMSCSRVMVLRLVGS